jgi:hydrogenase maturation factor
MCLGTTGVITAILDDNGVPMARVATLGNFLTACLLTCPQARPGQAVLVHCGYVLKVLDDAPPAPAKEERS